MKKVMPSTMLALAGCCYVAAWDLAHSGAQHGWGWPWFVVAGTVLCAIAAIVHCTSEE